MDMTIPTAPSSRAAANRQPVLTHAEQVMGTVVSCVIPVGAVPQLRVTNALKDACRVLHEADAVFSTWNPGSPMSQVRRGDLALNEAPPVIGQVLETCEVARERSGGWFDPWAMPGGVDPTGLVKGWAAQQAAAELQAAGITSAMINAAGDIVAWGQPEPGRPWLVGVRDPRRPERLAYIVPVEGAIATSAHYERPGQVLDPRDCRPALGLRSATVVGADLAMADALATGLLAAGTAGLSHIAALEGYSASTMGNAGVIRVTPGFPPTTSPPSARRDMPSTTNNGRRTRRRPRGRKQMAIPVA
jgi:thiamine biosynthesis lipoprotein